MPNIIAKCGGFVFDNTMQAVNEVVAPSDAHAVVKEDYITPCGQPFDGNSFKVVTRGNSKILTMHDAYCPEQMEIIKGKCGIGLDKRFFAVNEKVVSLTNAPVYYILTVEATPADAVLDIEDPDVVSIQPMPGTTNKFMLNRIGEQYVVNVTKDGYVSNRQAVTNNKTQTIKVDLQLDPVP